MAGQTAWNPYLALKEHLSLSTEKIKNAVNSADLSSIKQLDNFYERPRKVATSTSSIGSWINREFDTPNDLRHIMICDKILQSVGKKLGTRREFIKQQIMSFPLRPVGVWKTYRFIGSYNDSSALPEEKIRFSYTCFLPVPVSGENNDDNIWVHAHGYDQTWIGKTSADNGLIYISHIRTRNIENKITNSKDMSYTVMNAFDSSIKIEQSNCMRGVFVGAVVPEDYKTGTNIPIVASRTLMIEDIEKTIDSIINPNDWIIVKKGVNERKIIDSNDFDLEMQNIIKLIRSDIRGPAWGGSRIYVT